MDASQDRPQKPQCFWTWTKYKAVFYWIWSTSVSIFCIDWQWLFWVSQVMAFHITFHWRSFKWRCSGLNLGHSEFLPIIKHLLFHWAAALALAHFMISGVSMSVSSPCCGPNMQAEQTLNCFSKHGKSARSNRCLVHFKKNIVYFYFDFQTRPHKTMQ